MVVDSSAFHLVRSGYDCSRPDHLSQHARSERALRGRPHL